MTEIPGPLASTEVLKRGKVEYIFGMPGGANLRMYDALRGSNIGDVLTRHEQLAAHMADAYGPVSGKAGVCSATSGPSPHSMELEVVGSANTIDNFVQRLRSDNVLDIARTGVAALPKEA